MFCPKCGSQQPDNATFCASCGSSLGHTAPQPQQQPQWQPQSQYGNAPVYEEAEKSAGQVVVWQVILGVAIPLVGWIMGATQLFSGSNKKNGQTLLIASTISFAIAYILL